MQISDKHIEEFQKIWRNKFNEEMCREEAIEKYNSMVNLIKLISRMNYGNIKL